jgi:hypothetical protein
LRRAEGGAKIVGVFRVKNHKKKHKGHKELRTNSKVSIGHQSISFFFAYF